MPMINGFSILILEREKRFDLFLSTMKGLESRIQLDKAGFKDPTIYEH